MPGGGKREGAGRPKGATAPGPKAKTVAVALYPDEIAFLDALQERLGLRSRSATLREVLREYRGRHGAGWSPDD